MKASFFLSLQQKNVQYGKYIYFRNKLNIKYTFEYFLSFEIYLFQNTPHKSWN